MRSFRFGEGEGQPARCSSCAPSSAKIATTKYGELLRQGSIPVPKKESKSAEF